MRIGGIIKKWRILSELDVRTAAAQIGIGATTLIRIEKGGVPDGETLIKLLGWLLESEAPPETAVNEPSTS